MILGDGVHGREDRNDMPSDTHPLVDAARPHPLPVGGRMHRARVRHLPDTARSDRARIRTTREEIGDGGRDHQREGDDGSDGVSHPGSVSDQNL